MSLTGVNGICTSQRRPPFSVSVGVTRHESCTNSEYSFMLAGAAARAEERVLVRVSASSAAWPVTESTRPVSSA